MLAPSFSHGKPNVISVRNTEKKNSSASWSLVALKRIFLISRMYGKGWCQRLWKISETYFFYRCYLCQYVYNETKNLCFKSVTCVADNTVSTQSMCLHVKLCLTLGWSNYYFWSVCLYDSYVLITFKKLLFSRETGRLK